MLELIISYDKDSGMPASAVCTICGGAMSCPFTQATSSKDRINWFAEEFKWHVELHHAAPLAAPALRESAS